MINDFIGDFSLSYIDVVKNLRILIIQIMYILLSTHSFLMQLKQQLNICLTKIHKKGILILQIFFLRVKAHCKNSYGIKTNYLSCVFQVLMLNFYWIKLYISKMKPTLYIIFNNVS